MEMPSRELTKFLAVFCVEFHIVANPIYFLNCKNLKKNSKESVNITRFLNMVQVGSRVFFLNFVIFACEK
jgi:TRAP-type mannitol/chloroaromatic compound transport system permease large subunit